MASDDRALLRVFTCGSVDDGKSSLMGRLLLDSGLVPEDTLHALARDSRRAGAADGEIDVSLLFDGLEAEREQGITIDVAYRYFETRLRKVIVADAPGHVQYTRNMATAASLADLGVILVDARKGLLAQTRRHAAIASLMGVRSLVLAVNKMDLVDYDQAAFDAAALAFREACGTLAFESVAAIPVSAKLGDNVTRRSDRMGWYDGPTVLEAIDAAPAGDEGRGGPFRMPVQLVARAPDFRGYAGMVAGGGVRVGDPVLEARSGRATRVARILAAEADLDEAVAGQSVTLQLADEIDATRGDVLASPDAPPEVARQFAAHVVWMHDEPMAPGRVYMLKIGAQTVPASITSLKHVLDVDDMTRRPARTLALNDIGVCNVETAAPVAFDPYAANRAMGGFVLIDRFSARTVGAGMIDFGLRRAHSVHPQALDVAPEERSAIKGHGPAVVWLTGLSGSGKSTIANALDRLLIARGVHATLLDGDNLRGGLTKDLGFTEADRVENIRRVAEVARLMTDAGLIAICSFISPFRAERSLARDRAGPDRFVEVFVDAPIDVCRDRDPKGLYARAAAGEIKNFTGVDSPYEAPEAPDVHVRTNEMTASAAAQAILETLRARGIVP